MGPVDIPRGASACDDLLDRHSEVLLRIWELTRVHAHGSFQDAALAVVKEYLPFDGALWGYASVGGAVLKVHAVHLAGVPGNAIEEYERVKAVDPIAQRAIREPRRCICFDARRPPAGADPRWLAFNRRWDIHSIVTVMIVQEFANLAMFSSFYRSERSGRFTERERRLHQGLAPHLASAYRMARLRGIEQDSSRSEPGALAAISDGQGRLHLAEGGFEGILRAEWPEWHGPSLPGELVPLSRAGGAHRSATLVVSAAPPVEGFTTLWARAALPRDLLSSREAQVAAAWGSGKSAQEIADELGLSLNTVRNRVQDVYGKLKARSRIEVLVALGGTRRP